MGIYKRDFFSYEESQMSLRSAFRFSCLLLAWAGGTLKVCGQEVADTEIEFLEIEASHNGFNLEIKFTLTANQFVERLYMENSYDLKTWSSNEIYPNFEDEVEGQATFFSNPFGPTFYRAGIRFPTIALFQDSIQVANGRESQPVVFGFSDRAFPFDFPELEAISSNPALIPQESIKILRSSFSSSIQVTPTFDSVGDVPIDIIVTGSDGVTAKATLTVSVVEGGGIAPSASEFHEQVLERKFPGFDYIFSTIKPSLRFIRNGEPGNWFYGLDTDADEDKALLGFTYDESNNDATQFAELIRLTFITDHSGNYEYFEVINNFEQSKASGTFDLSAFPIFGAGASPTEAAFARMAIGKHIVNSAWTFDSETRFNYTEPNGGTPERGNWKYVKTGEITGRVTLTYDEDNNNAAIYLEEVDLTFESLETGSSVYREYFGTEINNTFPGVFDFTE